MEGGAIVSPGSAKCEEVLKDRQSRSWNEVQIMSASTEGLTSAVLGTDSQKTSILMSPRVVWRVTDMTLGYEGHDLSIYDLGERCRWFLY